MNKMPKLTVAALLVMASGQVLAADKSDVTVSGSIVPAACVPAVTGGAKFDYGGIKAASLSKDSFTSLDKKYLDFSLTCSSPMKVALTAVDGRAGTAVAGGEPLGVGADMPYRIFGLGQSEGKNIGSYALGVRVSGLKVDGKTGFEGISSGDNGATWSKGSYSAIWMDQGRYSSVAEKDTLEPVALTTLTGTIDMQAVINKASELDLTKTINLDGLVSIQVNYL